MQSSFYVHDANKEFPYYRETAFALIRNELLARNVTYANKEFPYYRETAFALIRNELLARNATYVNKEFPY